LVLEELDPAGDAQRFAAAVAQGTRLGHHEVQDKVGVFATVPECVDLALAVQDNCVVLPAQRLMHLDLILREELDLLGCGEVNVDAMPELPVFVGPECVEVAE
jgi:hypothetical protein